MKIKSDSEQSPNYEAQKHLQSILGPLNELVIIYSFVHHSTFIISLPSASLELGAKDKNKKTAHEVNKHLILINLFQQLFYPYMITFNLHTSPYYTQCIEKTDSEVKWFFKLTKAIIRPA